jgi:fibronectin-binding autotransporter adhesin
LLEGGTSQDPNIKQTFANANIDVASVTMAGPMAATKTNPAYAADSVEVTANTICSSLFAEGSGATLSIDPHATLTLTGGTFIAPTSLSGTISGGGTLVLMNGIQSLEAGVALDGPALSMSGDDVLTIDTSDTGLTDSHTFTQGSGTTLRIANGDTLALTGKATLAGTVTGGGTLNLAGGSQSLNQGAALKNLIMSGGDKLTVNAPVSDMGTLTQHAGTALTIGGDGSLDFQGSNVTLGGTTTLNDAAAITVENGTLLNTGTLISTGTSTASLVADNGSTPRHGRGTISSFGNSGLVAIRSDESDIVRPDQPAVIQSNELDVTGSLSNIKNGKVQVGSSTAGGTSTLSLDGGGTSTAGAFTVYANGVLDFAGGTFNLTGGTAAGAATLAGGGQVNLAGGTLELGGSAITIACQFSQNAGSTLEGTGTLTLTDGVNFTDDSGTAVETGGKKARTLLKSATTVSGDLALDGGRTLENTKGETLTWAAGDFYLGIDPLGVTVGGGTIMNDAGGTFDIESDGVVARGAGADTFSNAGTVTVTDSSKHTTTIATAFANLATGVVDVKSGTLDIAGAVSGAGTAEHGTGMIEIDGGTLEIDTTLTQNQVTFTPAGGNLVLADPSAFLGSIKNLGTNDAIDLTGPGFGVPGASGTTKLNYVGNSTKGVLTITDGKLRAQLVLFGDYVTAGFQESAYSGGGTEITYVQPSPGHLELAPGH